MGLIYPIYLENFQDLLVRNNGFQYNFAGMFLVTLYQVCSSCHDSSKDMAVRGRGVFSLYNYIKHFKNLFVRNHWTDFNITWQKCSFGDPHDALKKHGCCGGGGVGGGGSGRAIKCTKILEK